MLFLLYAAQASPALPAPSKAVLAMVVWRRPRPRPVSHTGGLCFGRHMD